jgi:chromosomal replication initiation ATPase DnaA
MRRSRRKAAPTWAPQRVLAHLHADGLIHEVAEVCAAHGVEPIALVGQARQARLVAARHELWTRVYRARGWSLSALGRLFGRDRTSIAHGIGKQHVND